MAAAKSISVAAAYRVAALAAKHVAKRHQRNQA